MSEMVAFVGRRLDDVETAVKDHLCIHCRIPVSPLRNVFGITGYTHDGSHFNAQGEWEQGWEGRRCAGTVLGAEAVQNPDRVLRDIAAKREIVMLYREAEAAIGHGPLAVRAATVARRDILHRVLATLATVDSDHPDYQPQWAV